ncbi:MAG: Gfo/Idh/MocA family protein [Christensenellales bacterium]|jgi:predicted dehydrogenase
MKFAIIGGGGGHFGHVLDAAREDPSLELCGIAPGESESIERLAGSVRSAGFSVPSYSSWQELVDKEKPDIAVLCPEYYLLAPLACRMLEMGVHVYSEKPCATTEEWLEKLIAAEENSAARYLAMFTYYYQPRFKKAFDIVSSGAIGEVRLINSQKSYKFGNSRPDFYRHKEKYGGTMLWVGIHAINWIHWFTGLKFESAHAFGSTGANRGFGQMDMTDVMSFRLENGVLASATVDYLNHPNYCAHGDDRLRVVGTEGTLDVIGNKILLYNDDHCGEIKYAEKDENMFAQYLRFLGGEEIRFNTQDCFDITRAALYAEKSAEEAREILWREES